MVLPEPVSPTIIVTLFSSITLRSSSLTLKTGKNSLYYFIVLNFAKSLTASFLFNKAAEN